MVRSNPRLSATKGLIAIQDNQNQQLINQKAQNPQNKPNVAAGVRSIKWKNKSNQVWLKITSKLKIIIKTKHINSS